MTIVFKVLYPFGPTLLMDFVFLYAADVRFSCEDSFLVNLETGDIDDAQDYLLPVLLFLLLLSLFIGARVWR